MNNQTTEQNTSGQHQKKVSFTREEIRKRYWAKNRVRLLEKDKTCPRRIKSLRVSNWKKRGVIGDLDVLYTNYLVSTNCACCNKEYKDRRDKCLDHDHITGSFRAFLCRGCNSFDRHLKKLEVKE